MNCTGNHLIIVSTVSHGRNLVSGKEIMDMYLYTNGG